MMSKLNYILLPKYQLLLVTFMMLSLFNYAQINRLDSATIYSETEFEPFLKDAIKIKDNPSINDTNKIIPELKYTFLNKQVPVTFEVDPIASAKIKGEPLVKLYHGYAKAGFGTNTTPLIELYYNSLRNKDYSYGFSGKHFSSSGISSNNYSGFSDNELNVFGKRFLKEFTLYGKLGYSRNVNHYYGFPDESLVTIANADDIRQELDNINASFSLARNFTDTNQIDYNFDINYHNINDLYQVAENHLDLNGKISKYHKNELYTIGVELNYNKLNNSLDEDNNLVLGLNPHISTTADKWQFQVGIGLYLNSYPDTKFHFYPKAEFKYDVVEHIIIPYVGIKGGLIANNLDNFYHENPFINTQTLATQNSNQKYDIYGGIRGYNQAVSKYNNYKEKVKKELDER